MEKNKAIPVKLKSYDIDAFKGVARWFIKGGDNFGLTLHAIGPMTRKEAEQWCLARGYAVVKEDVCKQVN